MALRPQPRTSSLNARPGGAVANELVAPLSGDGTICISTLTDAHVIVDVAGAVVDVTIAGAVGAGHATVSPCGADPGTSTLNYTPGKATANEVVAGLSLTGTICITTLTDAHVIVDVVGST